MPIERNPDRPTMVDVSVLRNPDLNALDKAVYAILCSYETHPVNYLVNKDVLMRETKASKIEISVTLRKLSNKGLIRLEK